LSGSRTWKNLRACERFQFVGKRAQLVHEGIVGVRNFLIVIFDGLEQRKHMLMDRLKMGDHLGVHSGSTFLDPGPLCAEKLLDLAETLNRRDLSAGVSWKADARNFIQVQTFDVPGPVIAIADSGRVMRMLLKPMVGPPGLEPGTNGL
jgi:hypothetical protein